MKIKTKCKSELQEYEKTDSKIYEKELYDLEKLSLDDSHKEWRKPDFERKLINIYDMKSMNDMNIIYDKK